MKLKFKLYEDFEVEDGDIYYDEETHNFYDGIPGEGWVQITDKNRIKNLKQEKRKWDYLQRHPEIKDAEQAERDRLANIKLKWDAEDFSKNILDNTDKVKKQVHDTNLKKAQTLAKQRESDWDSIKVASTAKEIIDTISKDLVENVLDNDEPPYDWEDTYNAYNFETVDSSILLKGSGVYEQEPNEDADKPKPFVYFFYDRSYTFNPGENDNNEMAWCKTEMGREIEDALKQKMGEGELVFQTYYFATTVHSDEQSALKEGGNKGDNLVDFIIDKTKNFYPSNIIIITDSDESTSRSNVQINGCVWTIFCDSKVDSLPKAFISKVNKVFYIDELTEKYHAKYIEHQKREGRI